jgi:hypothetical protein
LSYCLPLSPKQLLGPFTYCADIGLSANRPTLYDPLRKLLVRFHVDKYSVDIMLAWAILIVKSGGDPYLEMKLSSAECEKSYNPVQSVKSTGSTIGLAGLTGASVET